MLYIGEMFRWHWFLIDLTSNAYDVHHSPITSNQAPDSMSTTLQSSNCAFTSQAGKSAGRPRLRKAGVCIIASSECCVRCVCICTIHATLY